VVTVRLQDELLNAIHDCNPVDGLTHGFYRYPARFSPIFARETVKAFTRPGDLVLDPFMGGGTSLVESSILGCNSVGFDINSLAVFVSKVKTTPLSRSQIAQLKLWCSEMLPKLNLHLPVDRPWDWIDSGYQHNISSPETWRIRKLIELIENHIESLQIEKQRSFARCVLLNTSQWALDCRAIIPSVEQFRNQFQLNMQSMLEGIAQYSAQIATLKAEGLFPQTKCVNQSIANATKWTDRLSKEPTLIVTSPPYPGVHVLYHRWQVQGRRETKAPYWIANEQDGHYAPYYSFGERRQEGLKDYFDNALIAFSSIAQFCSPKTWLVQMVAFSDSSWQLPQYMEVMSEAGFKEASIASAGSSDGRLWREVPNRKWYTINTKKGGTKEVVLFHKLK
jgi:DNA methylase